MKKFGKRSTDEINTVHSDLQKILNLALSRSKVDFGISEGRRSIETQRGYFAIGRTTQLHRKPITNIDGITKLGKHNHDPALAADLYVYHPDKSTRDKIKYSEIHLAYIAGVIDSCAQELYEQDLIQHVVRWGANWDGDGVIDIDQSFDDYPHFELIVP